MKTQKFDVVDFLDSHEMIDDLQTVAMIFDALSTYGYRIQPTKLA